MGLKFGNLYRIRGIIYYSLSPYEQRPLAGLIKDGIPNTFRRFASQVFIIGPPFALTYLIYDWGEKEHARLQRKNPADFANDE